MFLDSERHSEIVQVRRYLTTEATGPVIVRCKSGTSSVMIDESTDCNSDKLLDVLDRYFDDTLKTAHTRLLDMSVYNGGTVRSAGDVEEDTFND